MPTPRNISIITMAAGSQPMLFKSSGASFDAEDRVHLSARCANLPIAKGARLCGMSIDRDLAPHRSAFAEVNGVRLHYLDWGGNGPPLAMVHGIGDNPHVFHDLAAFLRDDFRIIAYARRGHGQSESPPGPLPVRC